MSLDEKVGRHRARFRKVYPFGQSRPPDIRPFVDAATNVTKSLDFQRILREYPYNSVPTYLSTTVSGGISYATFLEATEQFTDQTSYTVTFSTPFSGTPYLAFAPSQSQTTGTDGQETPNVAWWVTGLSSTGFTANFSAPFTGKITYRGVHTTGSYPIYVNRDTDLPGSYAWVSAGSASLSNQSSVSMSFGALPSLPEYLNYNPVGSTSDELNIGQTIWEVSNSYAVNELSSPFTGIVHFLAMDTNASDTSPFTADPDLSSIPPTEWTPATPGSLTAWYRGDVVVYDGSNKVSQWTDQSGNGYHLLQSNASKKPTYVASIAGKNNKPGVEAVSTGEYLQCASFVMSVAKTVVIVVGGLTAGAYVSALTDGSTEYFYAYHPGLATFYNKDNVGGVHHMTSPGSNFFQANTDHIVMYDLTAPSLYRDNVSVGGVTIGSPLTAGTRTGDLSLFSAKNGGFGSRMQILEMIVYSKALNSAERTQLDSYLAARYG